MEQLWRFKCVGVLSFEQKNADRSGAVMGSGGLLWLIQVWLVPDGQLTHNGKLRQEGNGIQ